MDILPDTDTLAIWLQHYGSISLFILLAFGIIALPVPEESLMILAGIFMAKGILSIPATFIFALGGSISGITVSYLLGRATGFYLIRRYGGWVGIKESHAIKVHDWFEKYGKWTLTIGYFIPGIRHFTGYTAGATNLQFSVFCLFAYTGALFWVTTFLSIGFIFGEHWARIAEYLELHIEMAVITGIAVACLLYLVFTNIWDTE